MYWLLKLASHGLLAALAPADLRTVHVTVVCWDALIAEQVRQLHTSAAFTVITHSVHQQF
jgi:hypothetical protein